MSPAGGDSLTLSLHRPSPTRHDRSDQSTPRETQHLRGERGGTRRIGSRHGGADRTKAPSPVHSKTIHRMLLECTSNPSLFHSMGCTRHVSSMRTRPVSASSTSSMISCFRSTRLGRHASWNPSSIPRPSPWLRAHLTRQPCLSGSRNQGEGESDIRSRSRRGR